MTINTIILIIVAVYLLFIATMVKIPQGISNRFFLRFIPAALFVQVVLILVGYYDA